MSGWMFMSANDLKSFPENYDENSHYSDGMWLYLNNYYSSVHFHRAYKYRIMLSSVSQIKQMEITSRIYRKLLNSAKYTLALFFA